MAGRPDLAGASDVSRCPAARRGPERQAPSWIDFDLSERYQLPIKLSRGRLEAFLFVQNLFNTHWEQAVFAFESRLRNEASPVNDIHFVPGNPRSFMGGLAWYF